MNWIALLALALILGRLAAQLGLEWLNQRECGRHSGGLPDAFRGVMDAATYQRSIEYTLARSRFSQVSDAWHAAVLAAVLFSGVLPRALAAVQDRLGSGAGAMALFLLLVGLALAIPGLPLDWHEQFRLEQRFGFNTATPGTWWLDRARGLLLAVVLGFPLLLLVLKLVEWAGAAWWLWAWASLLAFQTVMMILAPVLILPLFNKFTALPEGELRDRLFQLAERTRFQTRSLEVMDGSKRSRHSNAFFTGLGRFRKIVLFDTLVQQLEPVELEAVLAHEIGHFKKKHIPKMLLFSAAGSLAGFWLISVLARQPSFVRAFGFEPGGIAPALLLFALLSGTVTFWLSPVFHAWSRRYEYEADAYAAGVMNAPAPLIAALRKLNEKNLSNLSPHPVYSGFYYSHPTLLERERALRSTGS
ncbi:MAG: M48 family metallopeptidase [Verrucomicrobiota bacterium]